MSRIDAQKELASLNEAIAKQEEELAELELFVVRNSSVPSDQERLAVKKRLEDYERILNEYSEALSARGLSKHNRSSTTTKYLTKLLEKSEDVKSRRDRLRAEVEKLREQLNRREGRAKQRRERAITDLSSAKEFIQKVRIELDKLGKTLTDTHGIVELREYSKTIRRGGGSVFPDSIEQLRNRIAAMEKRANRRIQELESDIASLEQHNAHEKARQTKARKSQGAAMKEYEESLSKKKDAEKVCGSEKKAIAIVSDAIKRNVQNGRKWYRAKVQAKIEGIDVGAIQARLNKIVDRFERGKDKLNVKQEEDVDKEIPGAFYAIVVPKELQEYMDNKKTVLAKMEPAEFRYFLLSPGDLMKWYRIVKERFEKDKAKYERETRVSKESLSAAQVKYNMIMKRVTRAGLEPLTE